MPLKREVKVTSQELLYRGKCFHDIRVVKDRQITCTSCGNELNIESNRIFSHPFLGILQCEICWNHINKAEEDDDDDGDKYCYICGDKKKLYDCSNKNCSAAFCKKCIKRNASLSLLNAEDENWKCFMCDPKPFWELRAVCAAVMDSLSKKNNRRSSKKIDRWTLPSEKERSKIQGRIRKNLRNICDGSGSDLSEEHVRINSTDSSSDSSSVITRKSTSQGQSRANPKAKTDRRNSRNSLKRQVSRSSLRERDYALNGNERSDSDDDSIYIVSKKSANRHAMKRNTKTDEKLKRNRTDYNHTDSSDEFEDAECKNRSKRLSKKAVVSHSSSEENNRRKQKSIRMSTVREENSGGSTSDEFQKVKLQKVNGNKFSNRKLVDLEKDYTHTPTAKNEITDESESEFDFNDVKAMLKECRKMCSNFQMHIEFLEQRYGRKDADQLLLKSVGKINKLSTMLQTKQKNLTTFYDSWSKARNRGRAVAKKSRKESSDDDEETSEEEARAREECSIGDAQHCAGMKERGKKNVSECDSEEIFSADETRSKKKRRDSLDSSAVKTDDTDRTLANKLKDSDAKHSRDAASPVLGTSKEKMTNEERSVRKQLFSKSVNVNDNKARATDDADSENEKRADVDICDKETEVEVSSRDESKTKTSADGHSTGKENTIDESMDMFDTSSDIPKNATENQTEAQKANCDKTRSSSRAEFPKNSEALSQESEVLSEGCGKSPSSRNGEREEGSPSRDKQGEEVVCASDEKDDHNDSKVIENTPEISSDAEAAAKKMLLESDSDESHCTSRKNADNEKEASNGVSDSDTSTIILPTNRKKTKAARNSDAEAEVPKESNERSDKDIGASSENAEKRQSRSESTSDSSDSSDFVILSSSRSEDEANECNLAVENVKAKQELLATSTEENSDSGSEADAGRVAQSTRRPKRNREPDGDGDLPASSKKKKKLQLSKNPHYRNDGKLRVSCKVHLVRLNEKVLKRHSYALQKSREYLEHKAFESLVNLDNIEKRRKKKGKDSDADDDDDDDDALSSKRKSSSKRKEKQTEESLMDHLKRIENDDALTAVGADLTSDESVYVEKVKEIDAAPVSNEALISEANRIARESLLHSSGSDNEKEVEHLIDSDDDNDDETKKTKDKMKRKKTEKQEEKQDDKKAKDGKNWRKDKILTMKFSDTESEAEKEKWSKKKEKAARNNSSDSDEDNKGQRMSKKKKKKKKKSMRRILDSDSDIKLTDCSSDTSEDSDDKQKRKHSSGSLSEEEKPKPKRKRIKKMASDSDSSDCKVEINNSQGSIPGKSGRKNIRKVLKDKQVAEDTKLAAKEEEERLKRIAERQALYNDMYEMRLAGEEKVEKLVLDFDTETKKELLSVHEELVRRLKPHQAQGIKFMWDACYESLERAKTTSGSGCIIAHCMGLGKTLQVIALTHTLLTHEETDVKTVLIVCPLSTVLNWRNEYNSWLKDLDDVEVYELTKFKKNYERKFQLQRWQQTGGVMIIGYEMFRNLTRPNKNIRKGMREAIEQYLVDPGADLVVCDEGHLLKNEESAISKCMRRVKTLRRIVLTGTPLQNNLTEYHCMVQFVKPNLLGTKKEFLNRFVNPIQNGQFDDSTALDVKIMKKRAHVLHKMLEGSVQRFDYSVLTPFLPPKQEYVIFVKLTDIQIKMYEYYLANLARIRKQNSGAGGTLFADYQSLQRIWTHPIVLRLNAAKVEKANEKKFTSDSEGSLKDFINDDTTDIDDSSNSSSNDSDVQAIDDTKDAPKRRTRNNPGENESEEEVKEEEVKEVPEAEWWTQFVQPEHFDDLRMSAKLLLLFEILKECEQIGDKLLIFSQSLYSLTLIEEFLKKIDDQTQNDTSLDTLGGHTGSWSLGLDYFRLDGQTSAENRSIWCKIFNRSTNTRARLFLISTRAGGLGINLTAANRVIIFDASWNPSHDVQSIFRIYRFGQKKPCYVYRFLAAGTMEEKIYNRQVTKLSLSCRVVDEQQIDRHFSTHELNELYMFEPYKSDADKPTLNLPKDRLLAEILLKYKDVVENYHEHDSLLKNQAEEELNEEERKQAWLEYEEEKKGKPVNVFNPVHQNNFLLQQYLMNSGMMQQGIQFEYETIYELFHKNYPNATLEQLELMTNRAVIEMYNYWEKQAALKQPMRNPMNMQQNYQQRPMMMPHTASNINAHQQISQLNQLHASGGYVNVNRPPQSNVAQRQDLGTNMFTYRNVPVADNVAGEASDIIEIPTTSSASTSNAQQSVQSTDKSKDKEE